MPHRQLGYKMYNRAFARGYQGVVPRTTSARQNKMPDRIQASVHRQTDNAADEEGIYDGCINQSNTREDKCIDALTFTRT